MGIHVIESFSSIVNEVMSADDLQIAMSEVCQALGFQFFALTHHVDVRSAPGRAIRLHNYPGRWAEYYDENAFGVSDPVHRASHVTSRGFSWSDLERMIPLTKFDRHMLSLCREGGIGDGFTVPANVPGEARGSCSFANEVGRPFPQSMLAMAQLAGLVAFESARRLWVNRSDPCNVSAPVLTDRQRDCAMWIGRGKSDWEISQILGVSEETVTRHVKNALERYGVSKRTCLAIQTLFDGTLTFDDVVIR